MNLSEVYEVIMVNAILDTVFKNNSGVSSYDIPLEKEDPQRVMFDQWLDGYRLTTDNVRDVNYATAYFRIMFLKEFECIDSSCICIPDILMEMGFGIEVHKTDIFNTTRQKTSCSIYRTDSTVYEECDSCQ